MAELETDHQRHVFAARFLAEFAHAFGARHIDTHRLLEIHVAARVDGEFEVGGMEVGRRGDIDRVKPLRFHDALRGIGSLKYQCGFDLRFAGLGGSRVESAA
jgi:hypothetical protein